MFRRTCVLLVFLAFLAFLGSPGLPAAGVPQGQASADANYLASVKQYLSGNTWIAVASGGTYGIDDNTAQNRKPIVSISFLDDINAAITYVGTPQENFTWNITNSKSNTVVLSFTAKEGTGEKSYVVRFNDKENKIMLLPKDKQGYDDQYYIVFKKK